VLPLPQGKFGACQRRYFLFFPLFKKSKIACMYLVGAFSHTLSARAMITRMVIATCSQISYLRS
jgi:hypothetical protein